MLEQKAAPVLAPTTESSLASRRIADALRARILDGHLTPGERVLQEDVAAQFGSSRLPVREAFRMLQADGLLSLVANSGAWVSQLTEAECAEAYRIRERLEPLLLRESMRFLTDTTIDALAGLAEQMEQAPGVEDFIRLDREFHLLAYSAAETPTLTEIIVKLWNTTQNHRRAFSLITEQNHMFAHAEHRLIVDAIQRGDADDAERQLLGHIHRTRVELLRHPELFD
ncbi:MAG: GntR family transcriptional regulator [Cryobacterium sp.]